MCGPLLWMIEECQRVPQVLREKEGKSSAKQSLQVSTFVFDLLATLSLATIGVLGATGILGMPLPAAYALIGCGAGMVLSYITIIALSRGGCLETCLRPCRKSEV